MTYSLDIRTVQRDGAEVKQAKCPGCETWGDIDEDQEKNLVSLMCELCGWHGNISEGQ